MYTNDLLESSIYGFNIEKKRYDVPMRMPEMHYHRFYEILHVTQNSRILKINNTEHLLDKNHIAIIPPFVPHQTVSGENFPESRILIDAAWDFICDIPFCAELVSGFSSKNPIVDCSTFSERVTFLEQELLSRCAKLSAETNRYAVLIYLSELFLLLSEHHTKSNNENEILEILKFIESHFSEKITLELLEKRFFLSRFTISRKLKAYTGMSLPQYVNTIRLIHAKKMLRQGLGVTDTALACGFGSVSDFDRIFCAETQMTPSQYRKQ